MNSKAKRAMIHQGAIRATRSKFIPETDRIKSQIQHIGRTNAFHRLGMNYGKPAVIAVVDEVKLVFVPSTSSKTIKSRISSASIPDSMVARTDNTDRLFRARDTRSFYSKRDSLVTAAVGVMPTVKPVPAKVIAWAKSKGLM